MEILPNRRSRFSGRSSTLAEPPVIANASENSVADMNPSPRQANTLAERLRSTFSVSSKFRWFPSQSTHLSSPRHEADLKSVRLNSSTEMKHQSTAASAGDKANDLWIPRAESLSVCDDIEQNHSKTNNNNQYPIDEIEEEDDGKSNVRRLQRMFDAAEPIRTKEPQPAKRAPSKRWVDKNRKDTSNCVTSKGDDKFARGNTLTLNTKENNDSANSEEAAGTFKWILVQNCGQIFSERGHHCVATVENIPKEIYLFGGFNGVNFFNDLYSFNIEDQIWSRKCPTGVLPYPRAGSKAIYRNGCIYVLCGVYLNNANEETYLNDVVAYDVVSRRWIKVETTGDIPAGRKDASVVLYYDEIYMFGGLGDAEDNYTFFGDMFVLNLTSFTWRRISDKPTNLKKRLFGSYRPSAVGMHTSVIATDEDGNTRGLMIVFGGLVNYVASELLFEFDISKSEWRKSPKTPVDVSPPARYMHSACTEGKHMYVYGGFADPDIWFRDLWQMDMTTYCWIQIKTGGIPPVASTFQGHANCDGIWYFFGGLDVARNRKYDEVRKIRLRNT